MDNATETLVIINSIVLIIFLIISIIALFYIIRILQRVDRISEKTELAVDNLEEAAQRFKDAATPIGFGRALGSLMTSLRRTDSVDTSNRNVRRK